MAQDASDQMARTATPPLRPSNRGRWSTLVGLPPFRRPKRLRMFLTAAICLALTDQSGLQAAAAFAQTDSVAAPTDPADYSFLVAGHAYGSHVATNVGLHPDFLARLTSLDKLDWQFLVLTGDTTRDGSRENWDAVRRELEPFDRPYYLAMGNHDDTEDGRRFLIEKYGNTFYSFDRGSERFVILDTQRVYGTISQDQLAFLRKCLDDSDGEIKNVLVFIHLILWNRHSKYQELKVNLGSRYARVRKSNFWEDVYPILQESAHKKIYVFAGDLGGRADSIPAFYDTWDHTTLVASGMGEVNDENFLQVNVKESSLSFRLVALNPTKDLGRLEDYTVENLIDYYDPKPVALASLLDSYRSRFTKLLVDRRFQAGVLLSGLLFSLIWVSHHLYSRWRRHP